MLNIAMAKAAGIYCISGADIEFFRIFAYEIRFKKTR